MRKTKTAKRIALALTVCLIAQAAASFAFADWTSFRGDANGHTDAGTPRAASEASLAWSKALGTSAAWDSSGSPLIIGDFLYIAASAKLYKINKRTGAVSGDADLKGSVGYVSYIAYGDGKIFVPLQGGDIQAFDAATLEPVWFADYSENTQQKKVRVRIAGTLGAGTVMDAGEAAAQYPGVALDTDWTQVGDKRVKIESIEYRAETQVVYRDGYLYTGVYYEHNNKESYGTFFAIETADGVPSNKYENKGFAWEYEETGGSLKGYYWAGVADAGKYILVAGDAGRLRALDAATGAAGASVDISTLPVDRGVARGGMTYIRAGSGGGDVYVPTKTVGGDKGGLWKVSFNEATGTFGAPKSAALSGGGGASAPAVAGGKLYAFSGGINRCGKLDVFDAATLERTATVDFGGYSQSFPLVSDAYGGKTYLYVMLNEAGNDSVIVIEDSAEFAKPVAHTLYRPGGSQSLNSLIADDDGTLYFVGGNGRLHALSSRKLPSDPMAGWYHFTSGAWNYYSNGKALTSWQKISGAYYYFNAKGEMLSGWQQIKGAYYYLSGADSGKMLSGWQKIKGAWYYLGGADSGKMVSGWQKIKGTWYYFSGASDGAMKTGWKKISGTWYYFGGANDGAMKTGTQKIGGKKYVFKASGAWVK
ncbi:MAG: PQQ-binding-like beta-propeller repeat protein [Clostridiales Family XIII bacterium]|jgi:hypothetical protein|nr:PQQ-binding-like beta-propeller repeat protein [Clostridiales Family XIII bacterium]